MISRKWSVIPATALLFASVAAEAQARLEDPSVFPVAIRGLWGTSSANCANQDDYGPLEVTAKGFSHYEISTDSILLKPIKDSSFQLSYAVSDAGSEEMVINKERWTLAPDGDSLLIEYPEGNERELYSRCERLK